MKDFSFYDEQSGLFIGRTFSTDLHPEHHPRQFAQTLKDHTPAGCAAIEGQHDHLSKRVDLSGETPVVIDYVPPQPSTDYDWNATAKRWELSPAAREQQAKRQAAQARIAALRDSQHDAVRALLLDPTNLDARKQLQAIDTQILNTRGLE